MDTGGEEVVAALRGALDERCKELRLLHRAASLLAGEADSTVLNELVALIPPAFLFPEKVRARIRVGATVHGCAGFPDNSPVITATFTGPDGVAGAVEAASIACPGDVAAPDCFVAGNNEQHLVAVTCARDSKRAVRRAMFRAAPGLGVMGMI